ncbi:3-hydroxy-3-methylglutaryl-CoA reductase [Wickerhamomyces ciferrii]|uniref:3-hydroxy-3-methylglutaryl coenzyme A reductase n=1 Tax=Wickerhamomyces ciferrii (strain ATCC 14091 / BCRC 22168 / CBS 111 / JCM 3599 / NBRC 0793 / NRRL Y-1031 F-60-10) TaxID=1206466 RepID=K0KVI3_WICCF|nr:3-hydroxy-3-methylglutaryl-CoA reductase [Wickerhamomyces ciferrii]CCH45937.1 3-hydroxy-3-methylglutaryl-CoA reductase [Wickerhamomyces ciferrii]
MTAILEKPLNGLATVLAFIGKLSALHPIHTLIVTSLLASIAYLNIVENYVGDSFNFTDSTYTLTNYYHPSGSKDSWVQVDDLSKISQDVEHYNIVPFQFKRGGDSQIPEIANSYSDESDEQVQFLITKENETSDLELNQLVSEDGTIWRFRDFHAKLGRYSDLVLKAYNKVSKLILGAEPFDIAIVTVAYLAMWYTFISLFIDMRKAGSKFWLGFSTLVSSFFAFLFALYTATEYLDIQIPALSITEGIPFLVATIGFKHKIALTQKLLTKYSTSEYYKKGAPNALYLAIKDQGSALLHDHLLVIVAFIGCSVYASHLEGLRNFCILSALILFFDLLTSVTFYSGILSLKLEINLIHRSTVLKQALQEDGLTQQTVDEVLRSDGDSSKVYSESTASSSVTIGKILAIILFFGFHIYGLGSTWLSDLDASAEYTESFAFSDSFFSQIPIGSKGTLVSVYPARFFLPSKFSIQIEDQILSTIGFISAAIRDKYISKFVLFAFAISVSINVYLLNAARIHSSSVESDLAKSKKSSKKATKKVEPKTPVVSTEPEQDVTKSSEIISSSDNESVESRPLDTLIELFKDGKVKSLYNDEIVSLVTNGNLPLYALEKQLGDTTRAVAVRRKAIAKLANAPVLETDKLPYLHYDYDRVFGACCENVIGYMPLPVGIVGPLIINGTPYHIPMATTEGCLVASAMRGCKAINVGGGVETVLTKDGMTRGPCVQFPTLKRAGACKIWLDSDEGQDLVKKAFNSTSRFARLQGIQTALAGTLLFIRFRTTTGDAMGMNMISKGVEFALKQMVEEFGWDDMQVISVSGNYCSDKKPAAINWIEGRGKSVVAEAIIPSETVSKVLKSSVKALVELNISKNLVGSAMAGSIGGFNAHASNLLTAVFLALGQDPAQNVESSNCMTLMKETPEGDLQISVSMPSIEVGTIGGGTILDPQGSMLELLGVRGPAAVPGANAQQLAQIIASIVLAGELSLCSALAAGHLVQSHMQHNRAGAGKK